ncbi:tyrosine-type recombinase/integrase [Glaciimonas soli]|uniref:Tyrosine-type recombinase/integrase n=1 Tax=Glaciimonas soli TaxID=2590999 RepID=A0A843YYL6_9BURK|nr:tyrosine-type recombinase/integrase [Glaciimonas soli]MQR02351.1 tyrosine-type recombinase/integrase [Glaciimonas soli]
MGRIPTKNLNLPRGMRSRKQRSGKIYYYLDTGNTPRKEIPLGPDYTLAVRKWSELTANKTPVSGMITFRFVAERYIKEVLKDKAPRTQSDNLIELNFLYNFFDQPPALIDKIQPVHIRQYMDWRLKKSRELIIAKNTDRVSRGLKPFEITGKEGQVRANREKALFSHIFNMARNWGLTSASNPCSGIKGYKETGRDVYVEDDVFKMVYDVADQPTRDAMDLAYLTGQRPADTVKYDEADIKDGALWLKQNKVKKKLRIEIIGELKIVIDRILARKRETSINQKIIYTQLIVNEKGKPLTQDALRQRFTKARGITKIDIAEFQFRDLRAKAGTDKAESAGDIRAAQKQLGHSSVTMTEQYTRNRRGDKVGPTK